MFSFALRLQKKGVSSHLLNLAPVLIISLDNGITMTLKWPVDLNLSVIILHVQQIFPYLCQDPAL